MLFKYQATTTANERQEGTIDAPNVDLAISSLQRRGLIILDIREAQKVSWLSRHLSFSGRPKMREVVILSRQLSTLFEAKVSALSTFRLLASEAENPMLRQVLTEITDDINAGVQISDAMAKHPKVFSDFYVNMVKSGEESGKLAEVFTYLASYLERSYGLISRARNALIYPIFIIFSFVVVMILMLVFVIPRLSDILLESGQELPFYTRLVVGVSSFFLNYGIFLLIVLAVLAVFIQRYLKTPNGRSSLDSFKLSLPIVGNLYKKLYLSRIADNLSTMLTSGIAMVRALEITAAVVGNKIYESILKESSEAVKSGNRVSAIMYKYSEIPGIMIQMMRVGEETGKLGYILETLSRFYEREVNNAVDTLVDLIEPALIVLLGVGVGVLLTSVLLPIYNLASSF